MNNKRYILTHTKSWHTLSEWIEHARATIVGTNLDPASNAQSNKVVKTTTFFDAEFNGLAQTWFRGVFLNPLYTRRSQRIPY